jgi:hypothetical protein
MQIHQRRFFVNTINMQKYQRGVFREHNLYADISAGIIAFVGATAGETPGKW